jgi:hypothetical protein
MDQELATATRGRVQLVLNKEIRKANMDINKVCKRFSNVGVLEINNINKEIRKANMDINKVCKIQ